MTGPERRSASNELPEDAAAPTAPTPAPYGRSCSNCSKAKCKCVYREDSSVCARCHRLGKRCEPSIPVRRLATSKRSLPSRTAQLEQKIDGLVSLLTSTRQVEAGTAIPIPIPPPVFEVSGSSSGHTPASTSDGPQTASNITTAPTQTSSDFFPAADICSPEEEEAFLARFQTSMLKYQPIIYLPPSTTAKQLREERPMLWLAIMCVSCTNAPRQLLITDTFKRKIAQKMVVEHERNMDNLLALLIFIGWAHFGRKEKPFLSTFVHLAIACAHEHGILRPLVQRIAVVAAFRPLCLTADNDGSNAEHDRTMKERRASLALFVISSSVSITIKKIDAIPWTPLMDDDLETLSQRPECPLDTILVIQVKLQMILEHANQAQKQFYGSISTPGSATSVTAAFVNTLRSQLQQVLTEIPTDIRDHPGIVNVVHFTELTLSECALTQIPVSSSTLANFDRLNNMNRCARTVIAYFDYIHGLPRVDYLSLPFSQYAYFSHHLVALYELSATDDPAWDRQALRDTINVVEVLDRFVKVMEEVANLAGCAETNNLFYRSARVMASLRDSWEAEISSGNPRPLYEINHPGPDAGSVDYMMQDLIPIYPDMGGFEEFLFSWDDMATR